RNKTNKGIAKTINISFKDLYEIIEKGNQIFRAEIKMKISYHGQSAIYLQTDSHHILIDSFITGNGLSDLDPETVEADVIILTHGHGDHLGDTEAIAKRTGSIVIAINEFSIYLGA